MKKHLIIGTLMFSTAAAFAAPRPAYDTGSTEFFYSKAQAGYSWSQSTSADGQEEVAGPQTLFLNGSYPINELAFIKGGYSRANSKLQSNINPNLTISETTTQVFTVGGGARFPIAMDVDFNVTAAYNWASTDQNLLNSSFQAETTKTDFAQFGAGLLMVVPDTNFYGAANFELSLKDETQTDIGAELGFKPSDQFSIAAVGKFDTDFNTTTVGVAGNLHF